jgi:uncharacterized membrane protein YphA (DoxX/SURF4 family)
MAGRARSDGPLVQLVTLFLRFALGAGFLSAVADRAGLWGPHGAPNVAWGEFGRFVDYTGTLNPWAPPALVPVLAWAATMAELVLGVLLLLGLWTRPVAVLSGLLLLGSALGMLVALGIKAPLDSSVFAASAAAFALAVLSGRRESPSLGLEPLRG